MELLITEIDEELLKECRNTLFQAAVDRYDDMLDMNGLGGNAYLQIKKRKTVANDAKDCYGLFCFIAGLTKFFPRELLSASSKYIDIFDGKQSESDMNHTIEREVNGCKCKELEAAIIKIISDLGELQEKVDRGNDEKLTMEKKINVNIGKLYDRVRAIEVNGAHSIDIGTTTQDKLSPASHNMVDAISKENQITPATPVESNKTFAQAVKSKSTVTVNTDPVPLSPEIVVLSGGKARNPKPTLNSDVPTSVILDHTKEDTHRVNDEVKSAICDDTGKSETYQKPQDRGDSTAWEVVKKKLNKAERQKPGEVNSRKEESGWKGRLRGAKATRTTPLYVSNLYKGDAESERTICEMVKSYAKEKSVPILATHIILNRYRDDTVGCKIVIPEDCKNKCLSRHFWPVDVRCREWEVRRNLNNPNATRKTRYQEQIPNSYHKWDDKYEEDYRLTNREGSYQYDNYDYRQEDTRVYDYRQEDSQDVNWWDCPSEYKNRNS